MRGLKLLSGVLGLLAATAVPWPAAAQERPIIAVFELDDRGSGLKGASLVNLTAYLSARLAECGYQVIPREQIRERLVSEKKGSFKECYDQSCQIALGRELAAQKMLSSQILKIGKTCKLTATVYDLGRAAAEQAATGGGPCTEESQLAAIESIVGRLCESLAAGRKVSEKALTDFEEAMKSAQKLKQKKERIRTAWDMLQTMARDPQLPVETRAGLVQKFLAEFKGDNPHLADAQALLRELLPGILAVESEPSGAEVLVDGAPAGKTPLEKKMKAGTYKVGASLAGHAAEEQQATLEPGKETRVRIALRDVRPATLVVATIPPGALVTVWSGQKALVQKASPFRHELGAGAYEVEAAIDDFRTERQAVVLAPGEKKDLSLVLTKIPPGTLVVLTRPAEATILLDGTPAGKSPLTLSLEAGAYEVEVVLEGYATAKRSVEVKSGATEVLELELEVESPGTLVLNTDPPGAIARLVEPGKQHRGKNRAEPRELGVTPAQAKLAPGRYTVVASMDGYEETQEQVKIEQGKSTELTLSLERSFPMNPYKRWGHIAFWGGLGAAGFAGLSAFMAKSAAEDNKAGDRSAAGESRTWAGVMYVAAGTGAALVVTGLILWALSPGDREWHERRGLAFGLEPSGSGAVLSVGGRW